jgi:hypothetical protein
MLACSGLLLQPADIGDDLDHLVLGDMRQRRHITEQPIMRPDPLFHGQAGGILIPLSREPNFG